MTDDHHSSAQVVIPWPTMDSHGADFGLILEVRSDFRVGSGGCGLKPALPGLPVAASGSWAANLAQKTGAS